MGCGASGALEMRSEWSKPHANAECAQERIPFDELPC